MVASAIKNLDVFDEEEIYEVDPNHPARPMEVVFDVPRAVIAGSPGNESVNES